MKKFICSVAVLTALMTAQAYASDCSDSCMELCGGLNISCGEDVCDYIENVLNNCNNTAYSNDLLIKLKEDIKNKFGLDVYYDFETKENTTEVTTASTIQTTQITTKPQIIPTTQITTNSPVITTEPQTEATTSKPVEFTTEKPTETTTASNNTNNYANQLLSLVNNERAKNGLSKLSLNSSLNNVAQIKAEDMKNNNYFSHTSPTYGSPFDMMKQFGIQFRAAGENIAKGQKSPQQVFEAWMNSEGHRKNILNQAFTQMGIGYTGPNSNYWVQMFIG